MTVAFALAHLLGKFPDFLPQTRVLQRPPFDLNYNLLKISQLRPLVGLTTNYDTLLIRAEKFNLEVMILNGKSRTRFVPVCVAGLVRGRTGRETCTY